ncbi:MAG: hypothetical protein ABSB22_12705 [Thermodesulfobacteriota bacterium]
MDEKRLAVKLAAQKDGPIYEVAVRPGTTPLQVMEHLNLPGHKLFTASGGGEIPNNTDLFAIIQDGEKVYAATEMVAG